MDELFNIYNELEAKLKLHAIEEDDVLIKSEKSINEIKSSITELRNIIKDFKFSSLETEIEFFKTVKPKVISKLIYHVNVYNIETNRPSGSVRVKKKYLHTELEKLKWYFDDNLEFYRYYRSGSTYLDHKYFVRGKHDIRLRLDSRYFEADPEFSTSHDYKVAKILANDLLEVYLENELTKLDYQGNKKDDLVPRNMLRWTGSKVALTELMYALFASGNFNNGNTDIKAMAAYFEKVFDVDLGSYYRTYLELRSRHNPTKFIDNLKDALERKMDEDDEK